MLEKPEKQKYRQNRPVVEISKVSIFFATFLSPPFIFHSLNLPYSPNRSSFTFHHHPHSQKSLSLFFTSQSISLFLFSPPNTAPRTLWSSCFGKNSHGDGGRQDGSDTADDADAEEAGSVLVVMFTSQGCKTSPTADLLLSRLGRGDFQLAVPVVILAFHVDYWDYVGWKDPFGSSQWTVRQKAYVEALGLDTIYTPQVVVQGKAQCIGNDENDLIESITSAPRYRAPTFQATFRRPTSDSLEVILTGALRIKVDSNGVDVMVALYENGLVTDCPRGENKGRVLSNDYVVRKLEKLCSVRDQPPKKTVSGTITFPLWSSFNSSRCGLAVFVQNNSHQIFASQNFHLPDDI